MKIEEGGSLKNLVRGDNKKQRLESIRVVHDDGFNHLWLNDDMLSYLSLMELIELRDECNKAIKKAAGV